MKQRILIVEDNILLSRVIGEWLAKCGYETASVMDEPSARRMLADGEFDLVLSDVRLPKGNGIALLEWMNRENIHVPFITMTEYASFPDAVRAIKLGACDYLVKPIYREQLLELAGTFLKRGCPYGRERTTSTGVQVRRRYWPNGTQNLSPLPICPFLYLAQTVLERNPLPGLSTNTVTATAPLSLP